jgi:hypothetical protein
MNHPGLQNGPNVIGLSSFFYKEGLKNTMEREPQLKKEKRKIAPGAANFYRRIMSFRQPDEPITVFATRIGVFPQLLFHWGNKGRHRYPSVEKTLVIAKKLGVRVGWLLVGEEPQWKNGEGNKEATGEGETKS